MKRVLSTILAIIACFVMGIAVLPAAGCSYQIEKQIDGMIELERWFPTSGVPNNMIYYNFSIQDVVFDVTTDKGSFYESMGRNIKMKPGESSGWLEDDNDICFDKSYISVKVENSEGVIGYAVIRLMFKSARYHTAEVVCAKVILNEKGEYSPISEKEANKRIEKYKV